GWGDHGSFRTRGGSIRSRMLSVLNASPVNGGVAIIARAITTTLKTNKGCGSGSFAWCGASAKNRSPPAGFSMADLPETLHAPVAHRQAMRAFAPSSTKSLYALRRGLCRAVLDDELPVPA